MESQGRNPTELQRQGQALQSAMRMATERSRGSWPVSLARHCELILISLWTWISKPSWKVCLHILETEYGVCVCGRTCFRSSQLRVKTQILQLWDVSPPASWATSLSSSDPSPNRAHMIIKWKKVGKILPWTLLGEAGGGVGWGGQAKWHKPLWKTGSFSES